MHLTCNAPGVFHVSTAQVAAAEGHGGARVACVHLTWDAPRGSHVNVAQVVAPARGGRAVPAPSVRPADVVRWGRDP